MRFVLSAVATFALGLVAVAPAVAQSKTGTIDFQRAVVETAEFKKAYAQLEATYKPKQDALAKAGDAATPRKHAEIAKTFGKKKLSEDEQKYVKSTIYLMQPKNACVDCHAKPKHRTAKSGTCAGCP